MVTHLNLTRSALVAALAALALATLAGADSATAATPCPIDQSGDIVYLPDSSGNVFYIRVTKTSCAVGNKVVRGFYRCRRANGKRGRCRKRVAGFSCREGKRTYTKLPSGEVTDFGAIVTCRSGSRRVVFGYKQNL